MSFLKQNRLGQSDLFVSELGFGCMSLPLADERLAEQMLLRAVDEGVTLFDTADLYNQGQNEAFVGAALKSVRHQVVIATKVGNRWTPGHTGWTWDPSPAYILQAAEASLRRLQTDHIDLYQLHGGTLEDPLDDIIATFEALRAKGWIRAYGISSIRPNVIRAYAEKSHIASVMTQYSALDRRPEEQVLPLLGEAGISVIARGPLASGLLATRSKVPSDAYLGYTPAQVVDIRARLDTLRSAASATDMALRYALSGVAVATTIPGASRMDQLEENLRAAALQPLTVEERHAAQSWYPANRYEAHR